ncbi:hypothetical protein [uncultured Tenacibaculum sp.]|uniref:hypothetical protein n=1 Tax=uncultured Tenacibaculum sp. TaxID=174713 RepID=UPI0026235469|nr:hypothetical protein [uncultured Tenacibaculum sp.]
MDSINAVLVLAGILVTIIHFNINHKNQIGIVKTQIEAQRKENQDTKLNGFQNSFWQKQLDLYIEVCTYAAQLTQFEINSDDYVIARKKFYVLYWGPLSIVEDTSVKEAMQNYSRQIKAYEASEIDLNTLEQKSFQLARICRESSIKRWDLKDFKLE